MPRKTLKPFSNDELRDAFSGAEGDRFPPVMTPHQLAALLQISVKTIYEWLGKGRLQGATRKRGKHVLIWRDRALNILFHGSEWTE